MAILSKSFSTLTAGAFFVLVLISPRSQRLRFYLNTAIYIAGLGICSVWGIVVSLLLSVVPSQRLNINKVVARSFWRLTSPLVGINFVVEGEHHFAQARPAVVVGNHQTAMDILYLGRIFPAHASIMAKKELQFAPLLGQFMSLSGAVFIDRKNLKDSIKAFRHVGQIMNRKKLSLWIFPEGTRSGLATPDLLPFKKGAFHLAIQAGVPVVPVVCENYNRLFDSKSRFESGTIKIKVLQPIPTKHLTADDAAQLTDKVRNLMLDELNKMDQERQRADTAGVDTKEAKMRGICGMFSGLVGTGKSFRSLNSLVDAKEKELRLKGTSGENPQDYHLVSEGQKEK
ncbi:related to SLC1 - 1-acyl-sn-gylcerol-3-phosphate acyltransferase [Melanopsichium pennsylvanicum]|uniref:1-acyl-sn-glycerol-3-phosphate acyltransferase n=2 Tax=Melanopsichium pennsylvanicum TaxID=63383 RepID=A0AAJ5C8K7_9BASI|nr:related to SLC1 - 1-acyl-sn-gylcerol-3-phosphate acyltransferase [Melanopsichium pennsylvanicum]